jgi:hypothetical protein
MAKRIISIVIIFPRLANHSRYLWSPGSLTRNPLIDRPTQYNFPFFFENQHNTLNIATHV